MAPIQRKSPPGRPAWPHTAPSLPVGPWWGAVILGMLALGGCERNYDSILALSPNIERGQFLYNGNCAGCHGKDGTGLTGPSLFERLPTLTGPEILAAIEEGPGDMPAFAGEFEDQELRNIHGYITLEFQD